MYWLTKLAKYKMALSIAFALCLGIFLVPSNVGAIGADCVVSSECGDAEICSADGKCIGEDTIDFGMETIQTKTGLGGDDVRGTIATIIQVALGLLGIIAVVIVLWGGFVWMTAGGNEEKAGEARKIIFSGIIGLAIVLSAYAISTFVLNKLGTATMTDYEEYVPTTL